MKKIFWQFLALLGLSSAVLVSPAQAAPSFAPLPPPMISSMEKQRIFVADLVRRNFPAMRITKSESDFVVLQRIVDKALVRPEQTWELQALGICFGDALTSYISDLEWTLVTDEYGTDPTLRYKNSSVQINALTLISKRIERGENISIAGIAQQTKSFLAEKAKSFR